MLSLRDHITQKIMFFNITQIKHKHHNEEFNSIFAASLINKK